MLFCYTMISYGDTRGTLHFELNLFDCINGFYPGDEIVKGVYTIKQGHFT